MSRKILTSPGRDIGLRLIAFVDLEPKGDRGTVDDFC